MVCSLRGAGGTIEWIADEIGRNMEKTVQSCTIPVHLADTSLAVAKNQILTDPQTPCFADHTQCDFKIFPRFKIVLICHCFVPVEEMKQNTVVGFCIARGLQRRLQQWQDQ